MDEENSSRIDELEERIALLERSNEERGASIANALAVLQATKSISEGLSRSVSVQEILDYAIDLFPLAEAGLITAYDEESNYDQVLAVHNHDPELFAQVHMSVNQGATGWTYATGKARIYNGKNDVFSCIDDIDARDREILLAADGNLRSSLMCAPLVVHGKTIGAIQIEHYSDDRQFSDLDLQLLENMVAAPLSIALDNTQLNMQLQERNQEIRYLLQRTISSQEEERTRVARELHDNVAQTLAGLRIAVNNVEGFVQDLPGSDTIMEYLQELDDSILETIGMTRNLAIDLRPDMLNSMGLESALRWYLQERVERVGTQVHFTVTGFDESELEDWVTTTLFRVAQEAFSNVIRHAQAANIFVTLASDDSKVVLTVADDGCGFNISDKTATQVDHIGLTGMEERLTMVGGSFEIISKQGEGTQIHASVPRRRSAL